ncbi:hypothetical protein [Marinobacterium aestuariivivens]|uniref:Ferritin n=1 Tax=Marinobacterium aestuariivivens TaxID=1698799 RepID=A0ABW2A6L7_9GAMM
MHPNATLPPQQSLAFAIALEDEQICNLRRWGLRIRPFDSELARLFGHLLKETEAHKGELLYHASRYLEWNQRLRSPIEVEDADEGDHFFIVRAETAQSILDSALAMKEQALCFYRYCSILEPRGSLLGGLYKNLGSFQDVHTQLLQDARGRLELPWRCAPAPSSAAIPDAGPFAKGQAGRPSPEKNPGLSI